MLPRSASASVTVLRGGQPAPCTTNPVLPSPCGWITSIPGRLPDSGANELGGGPVGGREPGPAGVGGERGGGPPAPPSSAPRIPAPAAPRATAAPARPAPLSQVVGRPPPRRRGPRGGVRPARQNGGAARQPPP